MKKIIAIAGFIGVFASQAFMVSAGYFNNDVYLLGNFFPFLRLRIILSEPLPLVRVISPFAYLPFLLLG